MNHDLLWLGGGLLFALLCLWGNLRQLRRRRLLIDTPTSKTLGVFVGLVELKGTAETEAPFTSFLAERVCVLYGWSVEESWSRTVTETYTDKDGKTQTRTRIESGWTTVASGGKSAPFYLQDDSGIILVRPDDAQWEMSSFFDETVSPLEGLYYAKGPACAVPDSDHRRRFVERGIALHANLFVIGPARERADIVAPEIAADKKAEIFLISVRSEEKVRSGMAGWAWLWGVLGFLLSCVPRLEFFFSDQTGFQTFAIGWPTFLLPGLYLFVWMLCWTWAAHNSLVNLRERVRQGWSLIDVQLKRRHDLIPQLVTVIAALSSHEQEVQTAVAKLRTQLAATAPGAAGPDFSGVAATVNAVVEKYPQLTAQPGFAALHKNLVETEQRIALARAYYNDIATAFATRLEIVPDRWVAGLRGMKPEPLLLAQDFERAPVIVNLA